VCVLIGDRGPVADLASRQCLCGLCRRGAHRLCATRWPFPGFGVEAVRRAPPQSRRRRAGRFHGVLRYVARYYRNRLAGAIASAAGVNAVYLAGAGGVLLSTFVAGYLLVNKPA